MDVTRLIGAYSGAQPDPWAAEQCVSLGGSGHRGSSLRCTFNEAHMLAISEAVCRYRESRGIDGPLFLGRDTHALSETAKRTTLDVLATRGVDVVVDAADGYTPAPVISHAIVAHNRGRRHRLADGIVLTPSRNSPEDGGFIYKPPHGGPAETEVATWIQRRANGLLETAVRCVRRRPMHRTLPAPAVHTRDYLSAYVDDLPAVVDLEAIRAAGLRLRVHPNGGASLAFWEAVGERFGLDLTIADGTSFDLAFINDPDGHGVVTPTAGVLDPDRYLAACGAYLFGGNRDWPASVAVGKSVLGSSLIDRVAADLGRRLVELPAGFRWFVQGLLGGSLGFAGEDSGGASFLRHDGSVWTTDKDGLIACLLAAEMTARTGADPGELYRRLTERFGVPARRRLDVPATGPVSPEHLQVEELAGEPVRDVITVAPGNGEPIGGVKVVGEDGWFAALPSDTEGIYTIHAESLLGSDHLERIVDEAQSVVQGPVGVRLARAI